MTFGNSLCKTRLRKATTYHLSVDLLEGDGSYQLMDTTWLFENFPADEQYSLRLLSNATALQGPFSFLCHCHQAIIYPTQPLCMYFFPL